MHTALIIVDMQRSLIEDETWRPDHVLDRVCALESAARAAGVPIVYVTDTRVTPHGDLHARLNPRDGDGRITKSNCDAFLDTTLQAGLEAASVGHLVVCGLHTDFCIDTTCRRAASLGYRVTLAEDAHSTFERDYLTAEKVIEHHNRILNGFMAGRGAVSVVRSDRILFP